MAVLITISVPPISASVPMRPIMNDTVVPAGTHQVDDVAHLRTAHGRPRSGSSRRCPGRATADTSRPITPPMASSGSAVTAIGYAQPGTGGLLDDRVAAAQRGCMPTVKPLPSIARRVHLERGQHGSVDDRRGERTGLEDGDGVERLLDGAGRGTGDGALRNGVDRRGGVDAERRREHCHGSEHGQSDGGATQ